MATVPKRPLHATALCIADTASWYLALTLVAVILLGSLHDEAPSMMELARPSIRGGKIVDRPCEEIYVVGEGETLHTISDKCGDPFIVEENPHVHDPDDVFPGLVLKITPYKHR